MGISQHLHHAWKKVLKEFCPGGIIRFSDHVNWLLWIQRNRGSTLSFPSVTQLLTFSVSLIVATLQKKIILAACTVTSHGMGLKADRPVNWEFCLCNSALSPCLGTSSLQQTRHWSVSAFPAPPHHQSWTRLWDPHTPLSGSGVSQRSGKEWERNEPIEASSTLMRALLLQIVEVKKQMSKKGKLLIYWFVNDLIVTYDHS